MPPYSSLLPKSPPKANPLSHSAISLQWLISNLLVTLLMISYSYAKADTTRTSDDLNLNQFNEKHFWIDDLHNQWSNRLANSSDQLNDYFSLETDNGVTAPPVAEVWLIENNALDNHGDLSAAIKVKGKLKLPNLNKRFKIVFETMPEQVSTNITPSANDPLNLNNTTSSNNTPTQPRQSQSSLGLEWNILKDHDIRSDFKIGTRSGPEVYSNLSFERLWPIFGHQMIRTRLNNRYGSKNKGEVYLDGNYILPLSSQNTFEAASRLLWQQNNDGYVSYLHSVMLHHRFKQSLLSKKTPLHAVVGLSLYGEVYPYYEQNNTQTWIAARQSIFRPWFFMTSSLTLNQWQHTTDNKPAWTINVGCEAKIGR